MLKINQLWQLALQHQTEPEKFNYLVDILATLKPVELMDEFILQFDSLAQTTNKRHLLAMMIYAAQRKESDDQFAFISAQEQVPHIIKLQQFLKKLLAQSTDKIILHYVVQLYPCGRYFCRDTSDRTVM